MSLDNLPDVNFVDKDIETLLADMVAGYEEAYFQQTGISKKLYPGDPVRIWIYAQALKIYQAYQLIDFSAKQNLLKYSSGAFLDNIAARYGITRLPASKAVVTVRFTLSAPREDAVPIPAGTRVSPGNNIFFETTGYAEVSPGDTTVDIEARCTEAGVTGNGFTAGQINILVDPIQYVQGVANINTSEGGSDVETDEALRERIFIAPESFSVAGPTGAYEFFAKKYSSAISDVRVFSPSAGEVDIRVILQGGQVPEQAFLEGLNAYLDDRTIRPLTDHVTVQAPDVVSYDVDLTYYIRSQDVSSQEAIQQAVAAAVDTYVLWQKSRIGRDINPSELTARVIQAGAKRVEITSPVYAGIENYELAVAGNISVTYGGLEDD